MGLIKTGTIQITYPEVFEHKEEGAVHVFSNPTHGLGTIQLSVIKHKSLSYSFDIKEQQA